MLSRINSIPRTYSYVCKVYSLLSSNQRLGLPTWIFPAGLPVKIFKVILATRPAHLNLRDLITFNTLCENYEAVFTPHSHPFLA